MKTLFNFLFGAGMIVLAFFLLTYWASELSLQGTINILVLISAIGSLISGMISLSFVKTDIGERELKQIIKAFNISGKVINWTAVILFILLIIYWFLNWLYNV